MKSKSPSQGETRYLKPFLLCLGLLIGILALLFWRSFLPDYTVFSNDGPLGAMAATQNRLPAIITGMWMDLNWVGGAYPAPAPMLSTALRLVTTPLLCSKILCPFSLFVVGLCAWICFRQYRFSPTACLLVALAAALNSDFFNTAAWGVCSQPVAFGMNFLALAALADTTSPQRWLRVVLAGFAVGLGVMEAFDIGALFSFFVAAFVVVQSLVSDGPPIKRIANGLGRLAVVGVCAAFIAAAALTALISTQVKGIVGMSQDAETKAMRWNQAVQYSLPKIETLGMIVPGLFGFRADSPGGSAYWGRGGSDPTWDEYVETDGQRGRPGGAFRAGAGSNYAGVLVILVAAFGIAQSLRRPGGPFSITEKRLIWFWSAALIGAMLLMWGRFAPFYQFFYALPYASTIRNPAKFHHLVQWSLLILFAYGAEAVGRAGFSASSGVKAGLSAHWKTFWAKPTGFERKWVVGSIMAVAVLGLGWLVFVSARGRLENHLVELTRLQYLAQGASPEAAANAAFSTRGAAGATVDASVGQVGRTLLFLIASVALLAITLSGYFRGPRAKAGGVAFGLLLLADLFPINTAWVVFVNWQVKYQPNSVIEFLRAQPFEQRVAIFPLDRFLNLNRLPPEMRPLANQYYNFAQLYGTEWTQHLFQYYDIQSLDIVQEPRVAADKAAFEGVMAFAPLRRWELTNTRYLVGPMALLDLFNQQIDPAQKRLRVAARFDLVAKTEQQEPSGLDQITTLMNTNGQLAVFDFAGALPRAKLYTNWKVSTNAPAKLLDWVKGLQSRLPQEMGTALAAQNSDDLATLKELADSSFDPTQTVLLAKPITTPAATNQSVGAASIVSYAPKHIVLQAKSESPAVLLLNDKYDPNWRVLVDGKPAALLRCNFIMRGVQVPPGEHRIEFHFVPPLTGLYVSLVALALGAALLGYLAVSAVRGDRAGTL